MRKCLIKLLKWYSDSNKFIIENAYVPLHLFDKKKNLSWYVPYGILTPHPDDLVLGQDLKIKSKVNELKSSVSKSPTIKHLG